VRTYQLAAVLWNSPSLIPLAIDSVWDLVTYASVIVALTTSSAFGFQRGTVLNLRETRDDAMTDAELRKKERDDAREEIREQVRLREVEREKARVKVQDVEAENAILRSALTGEVHWQAISEMLDHHHETAAHHWDVVERRVEEILQELRSRAHDDS